MAHAVNAEDDLELDDRTSLETVKLVEAGPDCTGLVDRTLL